MTVTITGNNDAPVLTVDQTGAVTEDATTPNLTDSGTLSFTDVDVNDTHTTSALLLSGPTWSGGTLSNVLTGAQITALTSGFTVDANSWDYTVANSLLQFLREGETITFSFTVTVTDNSGQGSNNSDSEVVTVTIGGNNDAPGADRRSDRRRRRRRDHPEPDRQRDAELHRRRRQRHPHHLSAAAERPDLVGRHAVERPDRRPDHGADLGLHGRRQQLGLHGRQLAAAVPGAKARPSPSPSR